MSYSDLIRGQMLDPTLEPPDEPDPIRRCDICGCGLYEEDHYFDIYGECLCDSCADEMYGKILREDSE